MRYGRHLVIFFRIVERCHHIEYIADGCLPEDAVGKFRQIMGQWFAFINVEATLCDAERGRD